MSHAPKITKLAIGGQISPLTADIYLKSKHARKALMTIAPQLSILKMNCKVDRVAQFWPSEMSKRGNGLAQILHEARHLEQLFLTLAPISLKFAQDLFQDQEWPVLRILDLNSGELDLPILKNISNSHANTLRELRLCKISLRGDDHWETLAEELGKHLSLILVALSCLNDGRNLSAIGHSRTYVTARNFMQRFISRNLEVFGDMDGAIMAWQRYEHACTLELESVCNKYYRIEVEEDGL